MICPTGKVENFLEQDWTGQIRLKGFDKFSFWRKCPASQRTPRTKIETDDCPGPLAKAGVDADASLDDSSENPEPL
jgi:hypothetical protein